MRSHPRLDVTPWLRCGCVTASPDPLQCPFCLAYEVERLYLATLKLDTCECLSCGARWDQEPSGAYRGRASRT